MTRRKSVCSKWTLVLLVVILCQFVDSRPQEVTSPSPANNAPTNNVQTTESTRISSENTPENTTKEEVTTNSSSRNVKTKGAGIGDSIKMVASQLLENPSNTSGPAPIVADTRIPPKLKNQLAQKHKIKTRHENGDEPSEHAHAGVAVPVTIEELESENKVNDAPNESSTSNEGISTWILLSNPTNKENITSTTEPTKVDDNIKKQKPIPSKNKTKRPQVNKVPIVKRPIIGSTNKSDLVAGGSAINENVYNKIKDTVLSNVQKNKSTSTPRTTTPSTTTVATTIEPPTTKKEVIKTTVTVPVIKVTSKPTKKKNKNKHKLTTTEAPLPNESALLPMEPKEQEIELEISTPAATTKKPKRTSTKKKKTKKRKTSKPKPETDTAVSEVKTSNKTKSSKPSKKPTITDVTGPITSQIYNYFSREVMPSVGVGVIGLASIVGIASYFLYPFATPVRRTFEVDKKDDLYKHNAEEYASDGNGQAEEEMLGTVLAGMPAHSKHKLNPYAGQTTQVNRNPYPVKKDQDIRYRHVSTSNYEPNYNVRYPQQKTGIAHGAVYPEPVNYSPQQPQYETRHVYTTESKYTYDKGPTGYTPSYPAVEPIYAAPQTGPSGISSYGNDASNAVVYGVKASADSNFKPVYPFEGQYYGEQQPTTSPPMTYPPTSMYLGSNNEEQPEDAKYDESTGEDEAGVDNKFVVGNVPKELSDSDTPAVVPEHGPRNLNRKKRSPVYQKRSITGSIEEILKAAKEQNKDVFLSNEIDEALGLTVQTVPVPTEPIKVETGNKSADIKEEIVPVYAVSVNPTEETKTTINAPVTMENNDFIVESVSTLPINGNKQEPTTETDMSNELDVTTKAFKVYEVFSSNSPLDPTEATDTNEVKTETTTAKSVMTETTTESKSETTSTMPPTSPASETKAPVSSTSRPRPTIYPEVITYPPLNQEGSIFTFLKRLIEFKYRLGLSIIQNTSESINRYLRSMETAAQSVANASKT